MLHQPPWRQTHRKQGKVFFFEKKKQKAFVCAVADYLERSASALVKVFWFFFPKKNCLLSSIFRIGWSARVRPTLTAAFY
jgi:hypothetical protein